VGLLRTFQYLGAMPHSAGVAIVFWSGPSSSGLHDLAGLMAGCAVLHLALVLMDRSLSSRNASRNTLRAENRHR
jgi:hypothetical protein